MMNMKAKLVKALSRIPIHKSGLRVVDTRESGFFELFKDREFKGACEIGVQDGHFSWFILNNLRCAKFFMVDPWELQDPLVYPEGRDSQAEHDAKHKRVGALFHDDILSGKAKIIRDYSSRAIPELNGELDWIYVDGNHTYDAASLDLRLCAKAVSDDGFICGHDLYEHPEYGVIRAVEYLCMTTDWRLWACTTEDGFWDNMTPSYVLRKNSEV